MNIKDKMIFKPGDEPSVMKSDPIGYLSPEGGVCHGCNQTGRVEMGRINKGGA